MKVSILGSGSSGNSIFLEISNHKILIDAGFSCKKLEEKLYGIGESLENIKSILITHEHIDHIMGAGIISRKYDIPIYISQESYELGREKLGKIEEKNIIFIEKDFYLGDSVRVYPFEVMHDAVKTLGFRIVGKNSKSIAISTDIGHVDNVVREHFKNVDIIIIECNYDYQMLMDCSYPWDLKHRVKSRNGHLSNDDAGKLICDVYSSKLKKVYLAHVSKDSNHYEIALRTVKSQLLTCNIDIELEIAYQDKWTNLFEI